MGFSPARLAERMDQMEISTSRLAEELDVTPECIRAWKRGDRTPTVANLKDAACVLDCDEEDLME